MYGHPMAEGIEGNDSVNTTETDKGNLSYNMKVSSFSLFALNLDEVRANKRPSIPAA